MDMRIIPKDDSAYPERLRWLHSPPERLYWRGELEVGRAVAVVGTRKMTPYGRHCAERFSRCLARLGITVVSGLALGVDGAAHAACLEAGGRTVAVLGSGVDDASIYPRAHFGLAGRVLSEGGAVLSEYAPGTPSYKDHFPARNRIVAGLSEAVLVIEAPARSGAMITARLALEEGRDVWAVPGPVDHANSEGTHRLIRQGATPITCEDDVAEALGLDLSRGETSYAPEELRIIETLRNAPFDPDEIARLSGMRPADLASLLTGLELRGAIRQLDDGRFGLYDAS